MPPIIPLLDSEIQHPQETTDVFKLNIVHSLLQKIEAISPVYLDDVIDRCRERIREDAWRINLERTGCPKLARTIASMAGIDREAAEAVFRPSRLDLIIEELKAFIAEKHGGRR